MIGKTFRQIFDYGKEKGILKKDNSNYAALHEKKNYKGGLGNLVEECWFGYEANSNPEADFQEAGVELKVTPYLKNSKGFRAKERLVLSMINYNDIIKESDFEHSHLWKKAHLILLVLYMHIKGQSDMDSVVNYVQLFTPPQEDIAIIKSDYEKILAKIKAGKAHELSEGDTLYLGACTKAATSAKRCSQPYSDVPAKPRAFSLKSSYMTAVLNKYIMQHINTYESIISNNGDVGDFEQFVTAKIAAFKGCGINRLKECFGIMGNPKNLPSLLAFRILGIKGNACEEFVKAGIAMKAIRIQKNGKIKESMSFAAIDYQNLAKETWEDSTFGNYLRNTRFFFVIYQEDFRGEYHLQGSRFWNMPLRDLEGDVRAVWQETHDIIAQGNLVLKLGKNGEFINNLPKKSQHPVSHVRPHARSRSDTASLPEGTQLHIGPGVEWSDLRQYTRQCFWLNGEYILRQIS